METYYCQQPFIKITHISPDPTYNPFLIQLFTCLCTQWPGTVEEWFILYYSSVCMKIQQRARRDTWNTHTTPHVETCSYAIDGISKQHISDIHSIQRHSLRSNTFDYMDGLTLPYGAYTNAYIQRVLQDIMEWKAGNSVNVCTAYWNSFWFRLIFFAMLMI